WMPLPSAASRYQRDRQLRQNPARFIRSMFCTSVRSRRCATSVRNAAASSSVRVLSSIGFSIGTSFVEGLCSIGRGRVERDSHHCPCERSEAISCSRVHHHVEIASSPTAPRNDNSLYCTVDRPVGTMRVTTIFSRSSRSGICGPILVFQKSV